MKAVVRRLQGAEGGGGKLYATLAFVLEDGQELELLVPSESLHAIAEIALSFAPSNVQQDVVEGKIVNHVHGFSLTEALATQTAGGASLCLTFGKRARFVGLLNRDMAADFARQLLETTKPPVIG